jgi:outer membrane biosynthesis protein TonB
VQDAAVAVSNAEADIEKSAKDAVARWLFPVHYHNGKPIAYVVMVPVRFDATPHFGPQ